MKKNIEFKMVDRQAYDSGNSNFVHSIKLVRELTGQGLKESKDLVDAVRTNGIGKILVPESTDLNKPEIIVCLNNLRKLGIATDLADAKAKKYVRQLREIACVAIMDGNEHLAKDIMAVTEKWGFFTGDDIPV